MPKSSRNNQNQPELEKLKIGTEPKTMEFSDLNDDAIGMIIDKLKLIDRVVLRKVSRGLRTLVDQKKSILKTLSVEREFDAISIIYNGGQFNYGPPNCRSFWPKVIKSENYLNVALDDVRYVIKDPAVELNEFNVYHHDHNFTEGLKNFLMSLDHKVSTKRFSADSIEPLLNILPYLKPGTLEIIAFSGSIENVEKSVMDQIANTEQWKQAKELSLTFAERMWPNEHMMHFKRFSVVELEMELDDVLDWMDFFSMSPNFEYAKINTLEDGIPIDIEEDLGDVVATEGDARNPTYIFHHPMATDPNHVLEIRMKEESDIISFKKIARPF